MIKAKAAGSPKQRKIMLNLIFLATARVPDAGTTLSLLAIAMGGLTFLRAKLK